MKLATHLLTHISRDVVSFI